MLARRSEVLCAKGEHLVCQADDLSCQSWNERMWSAGEPIDPSPTIDQAINGGYPWLGDRMLTPQNAARFRLVHRAARGHHLCP
jgi:hypothetical protein